MGASIAMGLDTLGQNPKYILLFQQRAGTVVWLCLGYPLLVLAHGLVCVTAWLLVFLIPVAKLSARTAVRVLLLPPERVCIRRLRMVSVALCGAGVPYPWWGLGGSPNCPSADGGAAGWGGYPVLLPCCQPLLLQICSGWHQCLCCQYPFSILG